MSLLEVLRLSFESLWANKFRTLLTMLGMIIGVGAVVLLVALGSGAKRYILGQFEGLGTNLIIVQPGKADKRSTFGPPVGAAQRKMTMQDVTALEKRALNLEAVTGLVFGTATLKFEENVNNVTILGTNDAFVRILNMKVGEGAFFTREEDDYGRRVVVLGHEIAWNVFGDDNPVGKKVKLNESEYRVIGTMAKTGNKLGFNFDSIVFIPTNAALRLFNDDKLFGIRAKASSRSGVDDAVEEIKEILKERRDGEEDFTLITQLAMMESMGQILNMLTWVLASIATISMIVGGIGIMNIMLVSVSERTQEIGIRRAVGARRWDIMKQFLVEAASLSALGGFIGIGGAYGITYAVYLFLPDFDMRAPGWVLLCGFLLSMFVGVIFGVWPARKAARIETLDALRYE